MRTATQQKNRLLIVRAGLTASTALVSVALAGPAFAACAGTACSVDTVADTTGGTSTSLRDALAYAAANAGTTVTISASLSGQTISLGSILPTVSQSTTIVGNGAVLDGGGTIQGLQAGGTSKGLAAITVAISGLTIQNVSATGGAGGTARTNWNSSGNGGGGLGAGGGLFIGSNANVAITDVAFSSTAAAGGSGGRNGGDVVGTSLGGAGGGLNGLGGGGAGGYNLNGSAGQFGGGGGGGGYFAGAGGAGGFGAGGGGGGAAFAPPGGAGGFGGSTGVTGGNNGTGGGGQGGGGAGLGGAVFVQAGGSLTVNGATTQTGGTVAGGDGTAGAYGAGIFYQGKSGTLSTLSFGAGNQSIANTIADYTGSGGTNPGGGSNVADQGGSLALAKTGSGTLALNGANTYSGGTTLSGGTLGYGNNSVLGTGTLTFDGGMLQVAPGIYTLANGIAINGTGGTIDTNGGYITLSGNIANGTGSTPGGLIIKDTSLYGGGSLTLAGTNTYTGATTIDGASNSLFVIADSKNALSPHSDFTVSGFGQLLLGYSNTIQSLSGNGLVASANALTAATLTIAPMTGQTATFSGTILDGGGLALSLTKTGAGTQILAGANTYSGGTTLSGGTLGYGNNSALGTGTLTFDGGMLQVAHGVYTLANGIAINGTGGTIDTNGGYFTLSGNIANGTGSTPGGLIIKDTSLYGGGSLILAGTNTYTGATKINGANNLFVIAGSKNALSPHSDFTVSGFGQLGLNGYSNTIQSVSGDGRVTSGNSFNAATLTIAPMTGQTATFSGTILDGSDLALSLTKTGAGTQILAGTNIYTGGTTISGGALVAGSTQALGAGAIVDNASLVFNAGGHYTNSISGTGTVTSTAGSLALVGANSYSGGTTLSGGSLFVGNNAALGTGTLTFDGGTLNPGKDAVMLANAVQINGTGGTLNAYNGFLTTLSGNISNGTGTVPGTLTITDSTGNGATVVFSGNNTYSGKTYVDASGTLRAGSTTALSPNSDHQVDGFLTLAGFSNAIRSLQGMGTVGNDLSTGPATLTITPPSGATATFTGSIRDGEGTGALSVTKEGAGTQILATAYPGSNNYTGATTINGGMLMGGAVDTFSHMSATTINKGGTLDMGGFAQTINAVGLNGGTLQNGSLTGAVTSAGGTISALSGSASVMLNSGLTIFTGLNSYTGGTTINGTSNVAGTISASNLVVASGGVLTGAGKLGDPLISTGGTLAPGDPNAGPGTLTIVGPLTFQPGSFYNVRITPTQNDKTNVTGPALLGGASVGVFAGAGVYAPNSHYTILTASGGLGGTTFNSIVTTNLAFLKSALTYDANNVYLNVSAAQAAPPPAPAPVLPATPSSIPSTPTNTLSTLTSTPATPSSSPSGTPATPTSTPAIITPDYTIAASTRNQRATASALTALGAANPSGAIATALNNTTVAQAQYAFDHLSGEVHASAQAVFLDDSRFVRDAAIDRIRQAFDPASASAGAVVTTASTSFTTWGRGFGSWGSADGDSNAAGTNRQVGGLFLGADARTEGNWRVGLIAGFGSTNFDAVARGSSGTSDDYTVAGYAGTEFGRIGVRFGGSYVWHDISTTRSGSFAGYNDTLKAKYGAEGAQSFGEVGYKLIVGAGVLEPFANVAIVGLRSDGYTEMGGEAALIGSAGSSLTEFTTLGVHASSQLAVGEMPTLVRGTLGWRHAAGDVIPVASGAFASGGSAFTVAGVPLARDGLVVDTGLEVQVAPAATLSLSYAGLISQSTRDQGVRGNFTWAY